MNKITTSDICQVCLRMDIKLHVIDQRLAEYHDELADYTVDAYEPKYCYECSHMLRKVYNFKAKCLMAAKVLKDWKKCKATKRKSLHIVHRELPPASLGFWQEGNAKIYSFNFDEDSGLVSNSTSPVESVSSSMGLSHIMVVPGIPFDSHGNDEASNQEQQNPLLTIKSEIEEEELNNLEFKDLITLKTERQEDSTFEEIIVKNDSDNEIKRTETDHLDDTTLNSADDITYSEDSDGYTYVPGKRKKKKLKVVQNDSSDIDSDDSSDRGKPKNGRKRTLAELANSLKEDSQRKNVKKKVEVKKDVVVKERFHSKRDIIAELSSALLATDPNEKPKRKKNLLFNKEHLKELVKKQLESCGELKTEDGDPIDKQFVIDCLDEKVTEFAMRQLWNAVRGKRIVSKKALKLYRGIQNKYKHDYETMFRIEYLNTKEKMMEEFDNRKTYECYLTAEFKCEICYQGFKHEKRLEYHRKSHHDESVGDFICSICKVRHKQKKGLISHISNNHEAVYKCKLCPLVTYYKGSMVNHYQWHKGVKFLCEPCDVTFSSKSAYCSHLSYRHSCRHVCTRCGRAFCTAVGLKWHTTRNHQDEAPPLEGEGPAECLSCELTFSTHDALLRHQRVTHRQVTKGRPPGTTYTYKSPGQFGPRKKPILTCRVCNAVGHSIGWLRLHFSTDHPAADMAVVYADKLTHLCDICGKGFTTVYTLRSHINQHTGLRPFSCEACPKRFLSAVALRNHRLYHLPPGKPCQYCGKKFRSQSNLANHIRFHVGDRCYKCKICGKGFLHRNTLNEHVRGVHYNVRRVRKTGVAEGERGHQRGRGVAPDIMERSLMLESQD